MIRIEYIFIAQKTVILILLIYAIFREIPCVFMVIDSVYLDLMIITPPGQVKPDASSCDDQEVDCFYR
jgi:hypothetical protein